MLVSDHMTCILRPDWTRLMNEVNSDGNFVLLFLKYLVFLIFAVFSQWKHNKKRLKNALVKNVGVGHFLGGCFSSGSVHMSIHTITYVVFTKKTFSEPLQLTGSQILRNSQVSLNKYFSSTYNFGCKFSKSFSKTDTFDNLIISKVAIFL